MLINEVSSIVGLSKKSIRYYEEEGVINPKRNSSNDYREYNEDDIKILRTVKFLRDLDIPINDIKKLQRKEISLKECMEEKIFKIEQEENNYQRVKDMCLEIIEANYEYSSIDIEKYSKEVYILRKRGFTMKNIKINNGKKIKGAITSSIVFSLFFIFLIALISYFQFTESEQMPWILYLFLMFIFTLPVVGIIITLKNRIKEIKGGEEDEASKY